MVSEMSVMIKVVRSLLCAVANSTNTVSMNSQYQNLGQVGGGTEIKVMYDVRHPRDIVHLKVITCFLAYHF